MASIIIRDESGSIRVVQSKPFAYEELLEKSIADVPGLLSLDVISDEAGRYVTLGRQWPAGSGTADVVLVGSDAILTVVETKLKRNPESRREVIAQVLEYAAYLSEWTVAEVARRTEEYYKTEAVSPSLKNASFNDILRHLLLEDAEESPEDFKTALEQNLKSGRIRLVVAVDEVGEQAQKIVTFLNSFSSFDIYLLQITSFADDGSEIFVPALYGYARKSRTQVSTRTWSWETFESELSFPSQQIQIAQELLTRLESLAIAADWHPEARYHSGGWVDLRCLNRAAMGVQISKRNGVEMWFMLKEHETVVLPPSVAHRKTPRYLYLSGSIEDLSDEILHELGWMALCEAGIDVTEST